jgi:1-aminocyclopropane-1-carboxylate deaminase
MMQINLNIEVQKLTSPLFNKVACEVLRLDQLHPIVSGNKWFKLKYQLKQAIEQNHHTVATFGGAFSNHIVATAFACKEFGLNSIGIIRGEKPAILSPTLTAAQNFGMQLLFFSRNDFNNKPLLQEKINPHYYWINEGGFSSLGMMGASEILNLVKLENYTHVLCSCGTGTMIAGLINSTLPNQEIIGISALKGYNNLSKDISKLLPTTKQYKAATILHDYHFGGYAKHPQTLIDWMNELWLLEDLPTDIVYTSKLLFATQDLIKQDYFKPNSKPLIIHSGGLQGNLSLPNNSLRF